MPKSTNMACGGRTTGSRARGAWPEGRTEAWGPQAAGGRAIARLSAAQAHSLPRRPRPPSPPPHLGVPDVQVAVGLGREAGDHLHRGQLRGEAGGREATGQAGWPAHAPRGSRRSGPRRAGPPPGAPRAQRATGCAGRGPAAHLAARLLQVLGQQVWRVGNVHLAARVAAIGWVGGGEGQARAEQWVPGPSRLGCLRRRSSGRAHRCRHRWGRDARQRREAQGCLHAPAGLGWRMRHSSSPQHSTAQHSTAQHSTAQHSNQPQRGTALHTPLNPHLKCTVVCTMLFSWGLVRKA